jgi:hypothetical protein
MGSAVTTFGSKRFEVKISGQTGFHSVENTLSTRFGIFPHCECPGAFAWAMMKVSYSRAS